MTDVTTAPQEFDFPETGRNAVLIDSGEVNQVMNVLLDIHDAIDEDLRNIESRFTEDEIRTLRHKRQALRSVMGMLRGDRGKNRDIERYDILDRLLLVMTPDNREFIIETDLSGEMEKTEEAIEAGCVVTSYKIVPETGNLVMVYQGVPGS